MEEQEKPSRFLTIILFIPIFIALYMLLAPYFYYGGPQNPLTTEPSPYGSFDLPNTENYGNPNIPLKVWEASAKKIKISVLFIRDPSQIYQTFSFKEVHGTGFSIENPDKNSSEKLVLTAKHVIFGDRKQPDLGSPLSVSPEGISTLGYYQYRLYASYEDRIYTLIQIGDTNLNYDAVVFKILEKDNLIPTVLMQKNVKLGDVIYAAGFGSQPSPVNLGGFFDIIEGPYSGMLDGIIKNGAPGEFFSKKLLRTTIPVEFGFSGGPTFNSRGEVIGMTVMMTRTAHYSYAISAEDLEDMVQKSLKK